METNLVSTSIVLFQMMCVVVVIAYLITRTRFFTETLAGIFSWKNQLILILIFGIVSIYGSESGISVLGAQINIRDLGPMVGGLTCGPVVGLGAGLIGAGYRMTMGGFTLVACTTATVLAGLLAGLVYLLNNRKFVSIQVAVLFAIGIEGLHMLLALVLSTPFSQAVEVVSTVAFPMIFANATGMFVFAFIVTNLIREKETQEQRDSYHSELERKNAELQIARDIQISFLPDHIPRFPGFNLAAMSIPAKEVGGDFYDVIQLSGGRVGVVIADVSGKGVPAALFMAFSRTVIRAQAPWHSRVSGTIRDANTMIEQDARSGMFVTLFFGIIDMEKKSMTYVNAGHNPPLLLRKDGSVEYLAPTGIALGAMEGMDYGEETVALDDGDCMVFYTDGVTEAVNIRDEQYGEERLLQVCTANRDSGAREILEKIREAVFSHAGGAPQFDDVTMIALKVEPE